jgi:predicted adenine nucleotide alpha hydrolase (AANH) superfamily ATPase
MPTKNMEDIFSILCKQQSKVPVVFSSKGWECSQCRVKEKYSKAALNKLQAHLLQAHCVGAEKRHNLEATKDLRKSQERGKKCPHCGIVQRNLTRHVQVYISTTTTTNTTTTTKKQPTTKS